MVSWKAKLIGGFLLIAVLGFTVWRIVVWYDNQIDAAELRGETRAYTAIENKTVKTNAKLDGAGVAIRDETNAKNADVDVVVRTVLVRGPGAAKACPVTPGGKAGVDQGVAPGAEDALASVHNGEGSELITLPFTAIVRIIGDHDKLVNIEAARRKNDQVTDEILATEAK